MTQGQAGEAYPVLLNTAASHSTGRCNGLREYIGRRPIAECLAWPRIEFARDPIQLSLTPSLSEVEASSDLALELLRPRVFLDT